MKIQRLTCCSNLISADAENRAGARTSLTKNQATLFG
jgi:hypothetical protein